MRSVWGPVARWQTIALVGAIALLLSTSSAIAQSAVGVPTNAAIGNSLQDAARQNEKQFIDREMGQGGVTGGLGGVTAFPTGRLRTSDHDPVQPPAFDHFSFRTHESSAFANVVVTVPGTVLGGQVKVSAFAGGNWLSVDLHSNANAIFDPGQFASAQNDSVLVGATVLWAKQSTYALATIIGIWGETKLIDGFTFSPGVDRYSFDTSGYMASGTVGHVFDLSGPSGPKLDLRGSLGHVDHEGDWFKAALDHRQKYTFSTWTGTGMATLFSNVNLQNGALLRPYVSGYVRQEFDYKNHLAVIQPDGTFSGQDGTQAHTYGGLDAGMTYTLGNLTLGAAFYSELSGDERTVGGRLGASWKLGGEPTPAQNPKLSPLPKSWTGFYLGAHAGFAWADVDMTYVSAGNPALAFAPTGSADTISSRGALGGGQIGYDWQIGGIVFGVEGAWSALSLKDERVGKFSVNDHWRTELNQLYSLTARLGLASGNWMPYVKAGYAGANLDSSLTVSDFPATHSAQASSWHNGWTVGGGAEYMLARNWSVGIEYNYYTFDSKDVSANRTVDNVVDRWSVTPDTIQSITGRMNFRFN